MVSPDQVESRAEGCRASGITAIVMNGKSGSVESKSCSSSWLSTSKTEMFDYCPAIRHRCIHLP